MEENYTECTVDVVTEETILTALYAQGNPCQCHYC